MLSQIGVWMFLLQEMQAARCFSKVALCPWRGVQLCLQVGPEISPERDLQFSAISRRCRHHPIDASVEKASISLSSVWKKLSGVALDRGVPALWVDPTPYNQRMSMMSAGLLANFRASLRPSRDSICWSVHMVAGDISAGTLARSEIASAHLMNTRARKSSPGISWAWCDCSSRTWRMALDSWRWSVRQKLWTVKWNQTISWFKMNQNTPDQARNFTLVRLVIFFLDIFLSHPPSTHFCESSLC